LRRPRRAWPIHCHSDPLHSVVARENLGAGLCHGHAQPGARAAGESGTSVGHLFTDCLAARSRVLPVAKPEDARGQFDTGPDHRPSHVVSVARETSVGDASRIACTGLVARGGDGGVSRCRRRVAPLSSEHRLQLDWRITTDPVTTNWSTPNCINRTAMTLRVVTEPCQQSDLPTQTGAA
jgi:hypothetical protein